MKERFLADMGVSSRIVDWLRQQGFDIVHLRDEGLQRLPDELIFQKAIQENRTVITFDLDFGEIASFSKKIQTSVIVFRLQNCSTSNVINRLKKVILESRIDLLNPSVILVEETRIRVRRFPIGN